MLIFFHLFLEKNSEQHSWRIWIWWMWKCCLKGLLLICGRMCCVGLRYSVLFRFAIWEVLIFNTNFIYIHDFDLAECHVSILKSQNKHDISIVTHSWVTKEMWFPYCSLYSHQYGTACPYLLGRSMPVKASSSLLPFSKFTVLVTCFLCF